MDFTTNTKVGVSEKPTVKYEVVKEALFTSGSPTISLMDRGTSSLPSILSVSDSSDRDICRICHCEGDVNMPLIAPCPCSGSLRFVHQACLQQWIKSSDTRCCELCKFEFIIEAKVKPFRKWEKLRISPVERRKILCSITFHAIAITCVVWSLYVLLDRTAEEMKSGALEWPFWTKLLVVVIGFTGGVLFMYVQCKMYAQLFRRWRSYNRVIFVRNAPEKQIVSADVLSLKGEDVESTAMIDDDHSKELSVVDEFHSCDSGSSSTLTVDEREKLVNECNNDVTSNVSTKDEDPLIVTVVADGNESGSTWRDEDKEILEPPTTKTVVEKQVKCYTCEVDFTKETFTMENTCVKPPESRIPITCSPNYKFCQVNLTVNEYYIILAFQRNCVEECEESCVVARGTEKSTCISCCNNNPSCGL